MDCPLCSTALRQHLLQPNLSLIACPAEKCVYPFNMTIAELHENNLILSNITRSDIMSNMQYKMVNEASIDKKLASFISKEDHDIV